MFQDRTLRKERKHHVPLNGLPRYVHANHSSNTEGTRTFLFSGGKKLSHRRGGLMPRKANQCPYLSGRKQGKWTELVCSLPAGGACPDPRCMANPDPWRRCRMPANRHARPRTVSASPRYHQRGRAVEAMACTLLRKQGYSVIRTMRYTSGIHLVAWCEWSPPIFIHVRRSRQTVTAAREVISLWPKEVAALQAIPRWDRMSVQFWVHAGPIHGWRFFGIFPGGVTEAEGLVA